MALFYYQALERNGRKTKGMIDKFSGMTRKMMRLRRIPRVMPASCCAVKSLSPCILKPG